MLRKSILGKRMIEGETLLNTSHRRLKMTLNDGEFTTGIGDGKYVVMIKKETDWSIDGGYSFESVTNSFELEREQAILLIEDLKEYLNKTS